MKHVPHANRYLAKPSRLPAVFVLTLALGLGLSAAAFGTKSGTQNGPPHAGDSQPLAAVTQCIPQILSIPLMISQFFR